MVISRAQVDEMLLHARAEFPNEACGVLAADGDRVVKVYPIRNADESPVHYTLEPAGQLAALTEIDDLGWDLAAIFHSHTRTRAYPSATDVEMARMSLAFYPETLYVIVSLATRDEPELRAFRLDGAEIVEEKLVLRS